MKIYSFYNNKGGVGKTTTCHQFAQQLSKDKKVLILDLDPQGNTTSKFIENRDEISNCAYKLLLDEQVSFNESIIEFNSNIHVIGNTLELQNANNEMLLKAVTTTPATRLKSKLQNSEIVNNYDYLLIDCPPTMDLLVTNALTITDKVIIPIMADGYSILGIEMLLKLINKIKLEYNQDLEIGGVFLNCYRNTKLHNEIYDKFTKYFPTMCQTKIKQYVLIQENTHKRELLIVNSKSKHIHEMYKQLINEVTNDTSGEEKL